MAGLLIALTAGVTLLYRSLDPGQARHAAIGGPFRLTDTNGRIVTDQNFRGHFLLIYFGYTSCPDICPTILDKMTRALAMMDNRRIIDPIFITIDPAHDTPAILKNYLGAFSPRLIGLTGTPGQLRQVEAAYHVVVRPGDTPGAIDHSAVLYVMGPDGKFLAPLASTLTASALAADLAHLVRAG